MCSRVVVYYPWKLQNEIFFLRTVVNLLVQLLEMDGADGLNKYFTASQLALMPPLERMSLSNRLKNYELLHQLGIQFIEFLIKLFLLVGVLATFISFNACIDC